MAKELRVQWGLERQTSSKRNGHAATQLQSECDWQAEPNIANLFSLHASTTVDSWRDGLGCNFLKSLEIRIQIGFALFLTFQIANPKRNRVVDSKPYLKV